MFVGVIVSQLPDKSPKLLIPTGNPQLTWIVIEIIHHIFQERM